MNVEINGLSQLTSAIGGIEGQIDRHVSLAMSKACLMVHAEAFNNCPRSPTASQLRNARKTNRPVRRVATSHSRPSPGGLRRSIDWSAGDGMKGEIFVEANSEGGQYAVRIHDERYETWQNRGLGTIALGEQAREKFIERAVDDNQERVRVILEAGLNEVQL